MKLTKCEIRWASGERYWFSTERIGRIWDVFGISVGQNKRQFIKEVMDELKERLASGFSLRIYKKNGQIQEERTYPRRLDPKRSKG